MNIIRQSASLAVLTAVALLGVAAFFISVPFAHATVSPCSGGVGSPLLVDVTQVVSNDPDSGNVSDWATDAFTKHIQVWLGSDSTTYCGQTTDSGTFVTNGTVSPEHGSSLPATVSGTFSGGALYEITGTLNPTPSWPTTGSVPANDCGGDGSTCPSGTYSQWISQYFTGESHTFDSWGWTYATTNNGTWVNASTGDTGEIGMVVDTNTNTGYGSIQDAVNAASSGDTININSGTYEESVLINNPLTLTGVTGGTQPVIAGTSTANYVVKINGVSGPVTLNNLEINGGGTTRGDNGFDYGVWVNNSGTSGTPVELKNLTVKNVWNTSANGIEVDASSVGGSYTLIHNDTISSFDKRGIRFIDSSGKVYSNEVIGDNVDGTSRVQNLVNLWGGSNVEIYDNQLHNALTTGGTPTWDSPGIFVAAFGGNGASTANIHDNQIYSDDTGITLGSYYTGMAGVDPVANTADNSTATIANNTFHDVNKAINLERSDVTATVHNNSFGTDVTDGMSSDDGNGGPATKASVDATKNYWGAASGPENATNNPSGSGAAIYDEVSFSPWFTDSTMTTLGFTTNTSGGEASTTVPDDTTVSGSDDGVDVTVDISAGTVVTGDVSWDGVLNPPTATTVNLSISGFTTSVGSALAIGSSDSDLTFDNAVKLTFAGQAGKQIGWYNHAGTFTEITTACTGSSDVTTQTANLAAGESCKINDDGSGNLVVWTKHFSTFVTYTSSAIPATPSGGGNGPIVSGGGGGGGGSVAVALPNNGSTAPTGGTTGGSVGGGQVLGAAVYNFTKDFGIGATGTDVTELQKILIAEGDLSIAAPTGTFGPLTKAAVVKYQTAHGISPQSGYVGPKTRATLNLGSTPTMTDEQRSLLIQQLQQQLQALLAQIQALTGTTTHQ